ncbi:family 78 glycoside hydrolase catalytic domain [Microbacterium enclense]|uniref:family 78 glycoside hydrolase catalytic domain n=1 Tax=Microbacterium enclense TaxID=993073 RepID=UPI003F7DC8DA
MRPLPFRAFAALIGASLIAGPIVTPISPALAETANTVELHVRTDDMVDPLGIGNRTPVFSWQLGGSIDPGVTQRSYELRVASTAENLSAGRADLWAPGVIESAGQRVAYAGSALTSRARIFWQVRVVLSDGTTSDWSAPATTELGLLEQGDWSGKWISDPAWQGSSAGLSLHPVTVPVGQVTGRYVRLDVTKMGLPVYENNANQYYTQLAEIEVKGADGKNLAQGASVSVSSDLNGYGWKASNLVDGITNSNDGNRRGWTSWGSQSSATVQGAQWVTIDLGSVKSFSSVVLYPRTDTFSPDGKTASFPSDFTIKTGTSGDSLVTSATVTNQATPAKAETASLPILAKEFDTDQGKTVASARLYAAGAGIFVPTLNGAAITDNVLEPGYTDYAKKVEYSVYDVTSALKTGRNAIGIELGTGLAQASSQNGKYTKISTNITSPRAIAQLEVRYTDGSSSTVVTDDSWRSTQGPTTMAQWYGGEDYDARREIAGWNVAGTDRSSWNPAAVVGAPGSATQLVARDAPALQIVDTFEGGAPTTPADGVRVYDLGTNVAGWPELTVDAPAGTELRVYIGELLTNGRVNQQNGTTGVPIYDTFISNGTKQTWHPKFVYHGMQYLEVRGVTSGVTVSDVKARVIRAANDQVGTLQTSDDTINAVHRLVDRAIQGNMYSVLTDCPDREKLGWMEQNHLVFGTIMRNYDVSAYARSVVQKIADSQLDNGMVPDTAPEYAIFGGGFRDDPNWGSAIILMPYAMYENYGDVETLNKHWPSMVKYIQYLDTKASGNLVNYPEGLGDWAEQLSGSARTPINLVANFGYYRAVDGMAKIAAATGKTAEAASYAQKAAAIRSAFTAAYYNTSSKSFGNNSQASNILALDIGAVPDADRQAVFDKVTADIAANNTHLTVGEIALPSVYRVLSAFGRDDLVHTLTVQPTKPSFGFFVQNGATSLPEYWDDTTGSRNHFMLGAIDEWFSKHLAGIDQETGSVAYQKLVFTPSIVGGMTHAESAYRTPYGQVASSWTVDASKAVSMSVTVPVGATATVNVPLPSSAAASFVPSFQNGAVYKGRVTKPNGTYAAFAVSNGTWTFGPDAAAQVQVTPSLSSESGVNGAGWSRTSVSVSFTDDAADATVEYRTGSAGSWTPATAPVVVSAAGQTVVNYRAVRSGAPVPGSEGSVTVKIDGDAPVTSVTTDPASGSGAPGAAVTATFSATDALSGVARTEYSVDGGSTWKTGTSVSFTDAGEHKVAYRSVDVAGNTEATKTVTLTVADPALKVTATASARCIAGKVTLTTIATNRDSVPVDVTITSPWGTKTVANVAPGKNATVAQSTRVTSIDAGSVTVTSTAAGGRAGSTTPTYAAFRCG